MALEQYHFPDDAVFRDEAREDAMEQLSFDMSFSLHSLPSSLIGLSSPSREPSVLEPDGSLKSSRVSSCRRGSSCDSNKPCDVCTPDPLRLEIFLE